MATAVRSVYARVCVFSLSLEPRLVPPQPMTAPKDNSWHTHLCAGMCTIRGQNVRVDKIRVKKITEL